MDSSISNDDVGGALAALGNRRIITPLDLARSISERKAGEIHVAGVEGSAAALVAHALFHQTARPIVYLAVDAAMAQKALGDLRFFDRFCPFALKSPSAGPSPCPIHRAHLSLPGVETPPYAEVISDRRAAMQRLGTLFHLACSPWQTLITTPAGLLRRVVPREVVARSGLEIRVDEPLDISDVTRILSASGYLRVPVVEDPGSFAIRGALLDVWPAQLDKPVRVEFFGDEVLGIKSFDPENQRTEHPLNQVTLPPARDVILSEASTDRARSELRALCDAVNIPSSKARSLIDDVASGRNVLGGDALLPAFYSLEALTSYLPDDTIFLIEDPARVLYALSEQWQSAHSSVPGKADPHFDLSTLLVSEAELSHDLSRKTTVSAHRSIVTTHSFPLDLDRLQLAPEDTPTLAFRDHADLKRANQTERELKGKAATLEPLVKRLLRWQEQDLTVVIAARTRAQSNRLAGVLEHRGFSIQSDEPETQNDADRLEDSLEEVQRTKTGSATRPPLRLVKGSLERGVVAELSGFVLITEEEIFGERAHRVVPKRAARGALDDLRALKQGDFVVHEEHGIGRYLGLERKALGKGSSIELLVIEYAGGDRLFLPVYRLNQIQKLSGSDATPKLDRLGGSTFAKTKAKARRRVREMADELLRLYAERNNTLKEPLPPIDDDYAEFEASFPFEGTPDQAAAISEVLRDLSLPQVMDRLICGDVGFGKTEVALRATFRNAMAGRQVAILCPTTVLAQQHFLTFSARLRNYPVSVRVLSRFQSKAEQQQTVADLRAGKVDVVVGTHRLLSHDVHFKNLGLLVIDEEQRFGVVHKERIKQLRSNVDALTLTATPIPRTLQLAIGGMREMSLISTAPADRRAIRTVISRFDEKVVREAVQRELGRGGQVFYVYNRVDGIYERAELLRRLIPGARVAVGHGQMSESVLEKTMLGFVNGDYDILVSTTIIESGLDIPRANTMLVDRADLFGLAQLYQLRGRVGRSHERAYCYLMVPPPSEMSDEARSRIEALERYSELGAGFHIATLDMEIRGAGNLLGAEQSGTVASVGFDLFCQMLAEATQELQGIEVVHEVDPELSFDMEALIPESYIAEIGVRLSLYKRLASAVDEAEVLSLATEMEDRFGSPPVEAQHLVDLMRMKTTLRHLRVLACEATGRSVTLHLREDTPLDAAKIGKLVATTRGTYKITPDMRLTRRLAQSEPATTSLALADKMLSELSALG